MGHEVTYHQFLRIIRYIRINRIQGQLYPDRVTRWTRQTRCELLPYPIHVHPIPLFSYPSSYYKVGKCSIYSRIVGIVHQVCKVCIVYTVHTNRKEGRIYEIILSFLYLQVGRWQNSRLEFDTGGIVPGSLGGLVGRTPIHLRQGVARGHSYIPTVCPLLKEPFTFFPKYHKNINTIRIIQIIHLLIYTQAYLSQSCSDYTTHILFLVPTHQRTSRW